MKKGAKIVAIARFLPPRVIKNREAIAAAQDDPLLQNEFFKAPLERRFAFPEFSAADLGVVAVKSLVKKTQIDPNDIDVILYSSAIQDYVNIAIGPDVQERSGAKRATVLNVDTGCVSFLSMLNLADAFIKAGVHRNIVIVTVTNFISRLDDFQKSPKSWVLGDGASATLVVPGESSILASEEKSYGENYGLMICRPRGADNQPQNYWQPNAGPLQVEFTEGMVDRLRHNAVNLVSQSVKSSIEKAGLSTDTVSFLITHQPNVGLMQKWRDAINIHAPRVFDTFQKYGNLFQSSIPVTLSEAVESGVIKPGDTIALGTFANGGDFVGSMVLKWK